MSTVARTSYPCASSVRAMFVIKDAFENKDLFTPRMHVWVENRV
jgi:hypothetical protein